VGIAYMIFGLARSAAMALSERHDEPGEDDPQARQANDPATTSRRDRRQEQTG
jgi:hypothetical protein